MQAIYEYMILKLDSPKLGLDFSFSPLFFLWFFNLQLNQYSYFTYTYTQRHTASYYCINDSSHSSFQLSNPHALAISNFGDAVYVAEIDPAKKNNVHKFEVVRTGEFP